MLDRKALIIAMMIYLFTTAAVVQAAPQSNDDHLQDQIVEQQLEKMGLDDIRHFWNQVIDEYGGFLPDIQQDHFQDFLQVKQKISFTNWLKGIVKFAFQEVLLNGKILVSLVILTILSMLLQSLHHTFEHGMISKIAYSIVFMVLMIICLNSFQLAISYTKTAIETMTSFIIALLPLLLALIASSGGVASAAFFHPVTVFLMTTNGLFVQKLILPLLFLAALLSIVSTLSEHHKMSQLASLLRNWSIGLLGILMTVFLAVVSVQGASAAVADGITIRTAKFVTGNFVPVVGRMFTDAADTVISASLLLKNTLGIAGMGILVMIAIFPAMKVLVMAFMYKLAAGLLQPLGDGPVIACLDTIAKSMIFVFAALAIVSFMFFLCITIMIVSGNIVMMMR